MPVARLHATPPLRLGPFRLAGPIAAGGMGVIWQGEHVGQGVPVAVKVMVADELQSQTFRQAFRNEAWAMARLDHRGIVMVFDQGEIPREVAAASEGHLQAGAPYLVMDLVDGGVLSDRPPRSFWELKKTLLLLLDALAHAHARGVIHRDLKPANVLLDPLPQRSGGLQLTDFGIAHAAEQSLAAADPGAAPVMGTLHYMAPEQMDGRWREFCPATDLYSLGCIAWELAAGQRPFDSEDPIELMDLHLEEPPPPFRPRFAVPEGFPRWLEALLRKEPYERPARAADAARELKALGDPDDQDLTTALGLTMDHMPSIRPEQVATRREQTDRDDPPETDTDLGLETLSTHRAVHRTTSWVEEPDETFDEDDRGRRTGARLALSWRRQRRAREWKTLAGAGLGLWGLRAIPLLGRDAELDVLWDALAAAHRERSARAVVLDGALGVGSSRVAHWLAERAHELGVADVLWATHSPHPSASDGLGRLVGRELRCVGLSASIREGTIADLLVRRGLTSEARATTLAPELARWVDPRRQDLVERGLSLGDEEDRPRFRSLYMLIRRMATRRPVLVWLDDAQWGAEALAFAEYVLRAQDQAPSDVLVVLSLRSEAIDPDSRAADLLRLLLAHPRTKSMPIGPLPAAAQYTLVRDVLGLGTTLAARVAEASGGNPLFAIELVGEWVRRGVLEAGPWGWRVRGEEEVDVPSDLPALWDARVESALAEMPAGTEDCLQLAAAFGGRVQRREFIAACGALGLTPPLGLLDRLFATHLAVPSKGGWSFVHDALRLALERRAGPGFEAMRAAARAAMEATHGPGVTTTPGASVPRR